MEAVDILSKQLYEAYPGLFRLSTSWFHFNVSSSKIAGGQKVVKTSNLYLAVSTIKNTRSPNLLFKCCKSAGYGAREKNVCCPAV